VDIEVEVVRRLVADQFPEWSDLPITPVPRQGNDNRTFRLGEELAVRLPSHERYVAGIIKEDRFLPRLGEHLAVAVPVPVATGRSSWEYPYPWSVRRWLVGDTPDRGVDLDRARFARDIGAFLRELRAVPAEDGPLAGLHSFYRGCHLSVYGDQVQAALTELADRVDVAACEVIWREAVRSVWSSAPVWAHGDFAVGNLLTAGGRLSGVLDFGTCAVGDPACDLVIAWTLLEGDEREIFREAAGLPADAWARARGWALWKALITVTDIESRDLQVQKNALAQVVGEPLRV
jgi:aminoglycoside phosphotransferase (APT) family kinase protein